MTLSLVLPASGVNVITIADQGVDLPAWTRRLHWPGAGDEHVALPADGSPRVWASRLDAAVMRAERPALILAEGIGCLAASWWARLSPAHYVERVAGALLFDPVAGDGATQRFASPTVSLPFPTVVVDTDRAPAALGTIVEQWGGRRLDGARARTRGDVAWTRAHRLMLRLTRGVVERDVARAYALRGVE